MAKKKKELKIGQEKINKKVQCTICDGTVENCQDYHEKIINNFMTGICKKDTNLHVLKFKKLENV